MKWLRDYVSPRVDGKTLVLRVPDECQADYVQHQIEHGIASAALNRFGLSVTIEIGMAQ